ncbi:hypothetical protein [Rubritalea profundi]|uniref:Uncharacterized protein n=1 Tax=Rubritalea profundi TaxID=1658618 RepID=A0A2S7U7G4_9BACT|nr:hypothetical protein [Rubritalea profundi]PQJ30153.1 hypothetical protein BSZ32_17865 [Rubritalea profundi]
MNQSAILIAAALAVWAGGGYIIGKNTAGGGSDDTAGAGSDDTQQSSARIMGPRADRGLSRSSISSRAKGPSSAKGGRRYSGSLEISNLPGNNNNRITALAQYYERLSPQQLEDEAKKINELPSTEYRMARILLFTRWGEVDAYTAFKYAKGRPNKTFIDDVRPIVLQGWASVDPASAGKYMTENPREFDRMGPASGFVNTRSAQCIIAGEWAKQDPNGAIAWANSLEKGQDEAVASVEREVAR